jgi:hypothetical protein
VKHLSGVAFWDRLLALPTTKLERVVRDKDSSLLRTFVNYGRKKFLNIGPKPGCLELFLEQLKISFILQIYTLKTIFSTALLPKVKY